MLEILFSRASAHVAYLRVLQFLGNQHNSSVSQAEIA